MKFLVFFALISYVSASALWGAHHADLVAAPVAHAEVVAAPALLSTGSSSSSRTQDSAGNYQFAYNEQHATGGSSRSESGSPGVATGSYTLNVADGRQRVVNYVADGLGFRAAIATNEPGTAAQAPAATAISSPFAPPAPVQPLVAHAPLVHAPVVEAVHHAPALVHSAPVLHAPVHHVAAPVTVHHVPAVSSYSTSINHHAAVLPALHHVAAPVAVHHAPVLAHHAAPLLSHGHLAAPLAHWK